LRDFLSDFVQEGWWLNDHRANRASPLLDRGATVVLEHDIASDEERRSLQYYRELLARHDLPWWAGIGFISDGQRWGMPILRSERQGPFTKAEAAVLSDAAPHFARAVSLAGKLALAQGFGAVEALERMGRSAFTIDATGLIVTANSLAEKSTGGDLIMWRGRLCAADPQSDRRLQTLMARAVSPQPPGTAPPQPVFVARRAGRPYMVEAFPAKGLIGDVFGRISALVVVTELDTRAKPPDATIRDAFGLTPAEGRLASILAGGEDLRTAADSLGITYETARAHLKAIFGKMQVSRQSELAAVLARMTLGSENRRSLNPNG
jgi:DNA-binding CsgD family transcriptional regulator